MMAVKLNPQFRKRIRRSVSQIVRPTPVVMRGVIGRADGTIYVSGMNKHIWVRVNGIKMSVFNNRITPLLDLPVIIGYDDINPNLLQVLGYDYGTQADSFPVHLPLHGETHRIFSQSGGNDIVWVELRQFLPLGVSVDGMEVDIYHGAVPTITGWTWVSDTTVDLTSYIPASDEKYVLIYADQDGAIQVIESDIKPSVVMSDIPNLPEWCTAIAAVKLYTGQTEILDDYDETDIVDLRFPERQSMAHTHEAEVINIELRQFLPLISTSETLNIHVYHGAVPTATGWEYLDDTIIDMTSHIPGSDEIYALVYVDTAGDVQVLEGTPVASVGYDDIPLVPALCTALAAVRMYAGQTAIEETDIVDLRFPEHPHALTLDADAANILDVSGMEIGLDVQDANTVLAGPTTGAANEPDFRALVLADMPPRTVTTITSDTTLDATYDVVIVDATGGDVDITLPSSIDVDGQDYNIKRIDGSANAVTVQITEEFLIDDNDDFLIDDNDDYLTDDLLDGADYIDGELSFLLDQYDAMHIVADADAGSWWIL